MRLMDMTSFVIIGENIHCTRIFKRGGIHAVELPGGGEGIKFTTGGESRVLPIPAHWGEVSPAYNDGKVKHVAVAVYIATEAGGDDVPVALDYLCSVARRQIDAGANFLDINVDEYTNDSVKRAETMTWLASFLGEHFDTPLSIDSSDPAVIAAGLAACRTDAGSPMCNSVSLERADCIDVVAQYGADVIVSAAGRSDMPSTPDERMANFNEIVPMLEAAGVERAKMHLDPLVFPLSTDPNHGKNFMETTRQAAAAFGGVHLGGGLSNVSFGMPQRKLLNMVFTWLCVQAGSDSGIIDPTSMPREAIAALDTESEPFKLAKSFLMGEDAYGMEFIAAHREGRLT